MLFFNRWFPLWEPPVSIKNRPMPHQKEQKILALLREELAKRSTGAALAYITLAIVIFFYHFKLVFWAPYVQAACVLMFIGALTRLIASRIYVKRQEKKIWTLLKATIWVNAIAWTIIFSLASYELKNEGLHFAVLVTIMAACQSGSLVTLSNSKSLYLPFMVACLIPLMSTALYQYFAHGAESGPYLFTCYAVFFVYQMIQFRTVRALQTDRLGNQVDLENSLHELKMSQDAFVEQTANIFHASKISALGEMAGGLSHEVNNSLMTIMGSVQQLERYFARDGVDNPDYIRKVKNSKDAIDQIKTVIDGLRFFSQQGEEAEKVDRPLEEIIQRTLNFINEMIKANEITMIVSPIPPIMVHCNPMQITQILFYLTKNAFDALEGVEDPMKRWIRISFTERDMDVEIRVMNGGPQISQDVKSRLFQPFFTTKKVGKGTGLSLSISKGIALAHKGDIYLEDSHDCTTFALKIPSSPLVTAHA